jgi:hypothetical protein
MLRALADVLTGGDPAIIGEFEEWRQVRVGRA